MPPFAALQTSYNGGELSQRMEGRVDQGIYQVSAAEVFNFVPSVEGPVIKRPGFQYIYPAIATASWLSEFIFSRTQAYMIEWSEQLLRFFTNGGIVEVAPGNPFTLAVPYTAADVPTVWQQQSYDRLYLTHGSYPPASVLRTSPITFTFGNLSLVNGPFADGNIDQTILVTVTGVLTVGGVATITSTAPIFLAGHIGSPVQVEAKDFSTIKAWEPQMQIDPGDIRRSEGKVYLADVGGGPRTGTIQPIHTHGTEWDGSAKGNDNAGHGPYGVPWIYQHDRFGIGTITAVGGGGTTATVTVTRAFPLSLPTVPSWRWALPAFSVASGWPRIVLLAFGRLIFFTNFEILGSVVADYGGGRVNMAVYDEAGVATSDMAFRRRLDISNPVLWAKVDRNGILVGTADGEYVIGKTNAGEAFSGSNMECVPQSRYGGSPVKPIQTGTSTLFVQKNGRKLREAGFSFQSDRYEAPNIVIWARHILKSGVRQLAFQQEPEEMVWVVRMDGILAMHPHVPEQEVKGFARAQHGGGLVLNVVSVPGGMGETDDLWILVQAPDGSRSIELQSPWWEEGETQLADAFFVDSGVTVVAPASKVITGAHWLANRLVSILADGGVLPPQIVASNGTLDLTAALAGLPVPGKVTFGLGYQARLTWLRPEVRGQAGGTIQGKRKRLASIILRLLDTVGVKVDPGTGRQEQLINRAASGPMDSPVPPFSGDTISRSIGGRWETDGQGTIISDDPLPCSIIAHIPTLTLEGVS
jgi:hypothetical protein